MARVVVGLVCGMVFGFGLSLSGMLDPDRVRGFLDVGGAWNPSLMFVLGGAVAVAALGHQLVRRLSHPAFGSAFNLPARTRIDAPLLIGSALFGIGWGAAGLCPGPAVAGLALGLAPLVIFVAAMLAGMLAYAWLFEGRA